MDLITNIRNLRIRYQQWNFGRKYKAGDKVDLERQLKAMQKARKLSEKRKCRLWVIRLFPGKFRICTKADVKGVLRNNGISTTINLYQLNEVIVFISKYNR
jgi:hypothetical protein